MPALEVNIFKVYRSGIRNRREIQALQDLALKVESGQIFSLLGPNGAGKTTFIKILLSLTHPSSGSAFVLDHPITEARVRRKIGYLPENHRFPGYLTGQQVLDAFGGLAGANRSTLRARTDTLLTLVGMKEWRNVKVRKYSKGMMQRLASRNTHQSGPCLSDEPTAASSRRAEGDTDVLRNPARREDHLLNSHLFRG
jgi:ABC-2 type transport system ATP-binding protein